MKALRELLRWMSDHLIPRRYVKVYGWDNWCVMEPREVPAWIEENERWQREEDIEGAQDFTTETVWRTRAWVNALPEFDVY